jgi:K(+)-stimulated pyrophosphate-energized sodium pump
MTARTAVHQMLIPALFVFLLPFGIGLLLGLDSLAGFLAGALVGGLVSGVWMVNAGGAWDNAKKYIEAGNYGGKGTATHAASVVGDTVGDPLKDTSGPAMNIIMKVMALTALIFVPLFH